MITRAWSRSWLGIASLALLTLAPAQRLVAQLCRPPASSNEAKTFAIFSVPLAFGPALAPEPRPHFQVGLEGAYLPKVDRATATPTICQPGKGPENTDLIFAVPRPRIGLPLPLGLALEASRIPPVRVAGVKANLFGVSLAKSFGLGSLVGSLRAHGTFGSIRAPITCARAALADPASECFNGTISDDRFSPNIIGADFTLGRTMLGGRLRPYIGGGYNRLEPRFRVSFTNRSRLPAPARNAERKARRSPTMACSIPTPHESDSNRKAFMSKVWLISGSSRGLGRELAKAVLAAGHRLVATARKPDDLDDLVAQYGERVRAVALDVTDPAAARAAVAVATSAFGRLDVVVNNAGYANVNSIEDMAEDDFRAQIETNFFGVVNVTRAALPVLRARRDGHIIQISSIGGRHATPGLSAYQSAKWAVGGFSEVLAKEVGPLGIRVTVVEPGGMRTDWAGSSMRTDDIRSDYQPTVGVVIEHLRGGADVMRGDPAKVAQAILQVTSEKEPPLRLLLGSDAVFLAGVEAADRAERDAKWKALSVSTDFDGVGDFAETAVAQTMMPSRG